MNSNAAISVIEITKSYGNFRAVDNLSFEVRRGEIFAMLGPNGAGKSTTLEMILGLRAPDSGTVEFWIDNSRRQIGVQLQTTPFFQGLTVIENLITA